MTTLKEYMKSSTIRSTVLVAAVIIIQLIGVGGPEAAETIDAIGQVEGGEVGRILDILALFGLGGVVRGRAKAKGPLGGKQ